MSDFDAKGGGFSRRAVTIGGGIAAALGIAALGVTVPRLFGKRYAKTPYDDLLALLVDRETAVRVGKRALDDIGPGAARRYGSGSGIATELHDSLDGRTLAQVMTVELAGQRLSEVGGWVLPTTLANLCLLAALQEQ